MTRLLPGDVAVVTGAARGIGLGLAQAFVARGLRVVLADIDADALDTARASLADRGGDVFAHAADVTTEASVSALASAALDRFGTVDVICNNAGSANDYAPSWEIAPDAWDRLIALNMWSVIHSIRAFVPILISKNAGHVLNTSSISGLRSGSASYGDYAMTKHAVVALTESLWDELRTVAPGVGATVLCPGFVRTTLAAEQAVKLEAARRRDGADAPQWGTPLEPSETADWAIRAIEADLLYAVPSRRPPDIIRERLARVARELDEQASWCPES